MKENEMATEQVGSATAGTAGTAEAGATSSGVKSYGWSMAAISRKDDGNESKNVVFRGFASVRTISEESWKRSGVKDQKDVRWDYTNNWSLELSKFSSAALEVLKKDSDFTIPEKSSGGGTTPTTDSTTTTK